MKKSIVALAAIATISSGFAGKTSAETHQVKLGETLWSISREHNVTVEELKSWNHLTSDIIYLNEKLQVSGEFEYTIQQGDTLSAIAKKFGVTVQDLVEWNHLKNKHLIYVGDTLIVKEGNKTKHVSVHKQTVEKPSSEKQEVKEQAPVQQAPVQKQPVEQNPVQEEAVEQAPVQQEPVKQAPVQKEAIEETPVQNETPEQAPVQNETPVQEKVENSDAPSPSSDTETAAKEQLTVTATAYTANCEGCSGKTSTGIDLKANPNQKVISVDPNVIPLGSKVYVEGYGTAIAGDTGGAIKGNKIDVFFPSENEAIQWGVKEVSVQILD
ncbi:LysM peptidoglycan-binding domain-containing protein [Bacillus sp. FJAT-47783]|uniref:LysM peptidoglycan-binding domain-containing protein n=1 Tax=Bacillus sp. FJAT-47783 TaxID=2922712 RepID=UPI001FAB8390